ncbi:CPBP family intramembrane glutamic endopeptidase [Hyphococcus sp.]|uniref:CPBP family intramembrane glutamic endopeptidase n=1 Tax=Hyphococcus sp. TaxID=2038636 RepID=UPI0035C6B5BF
MTKRAIALFLATLVLATWGLQSFGLKMNGGDPQADGMAPYLIGSMFMPTLWSVVYLLFFNRRAFAAVAWKPGRLSGWLVAALLPAGIAFTALAVFLNFNLATSGYFSFGADGATIASGPWVLGLGEQGWARFVANIAATAIAFSALNALAAVGEEFGWRGLLQPHMIREYGLVKGVALLGFVWAIWHLPANLAGYNYPEFPLLGAFVIFPVTLIAASFVLAALTIWSRSFWPAALFHGGINSIFEGVRSKTDATEGVSQLQLELVFTGVEVALAVFCLALLLIFYRAPRA